MSKRALRVGELVVAHSATRKPAIYAVPFSTPCVGAFTFGLYLGGNHTVRDALNDRDTTFVFVLDSATLLFGWCGASLIRRASGAALQETK